MRNIKDLTKTNEKVWVYFDSEELCREFFKETDLRFGDLPKEKWSAGYVIAVHSDGNMGHNTTVCMVQIILMRK